MRVLGVVAGLIAFTIGFCNYVQHRPEARGLQASGQSPLRLR